MFNYYYYRWVEPSLIFLGLLAHSILALWAAVILVKSIKLLYVPACLDLDNAVAAVVILLAVALANVVRYYKQFMGLVNV